MMFVVASDFRGSQEGSASLQMVVAVMVCCLVALSVLSFCWALFSCVTVESRLNAALARLDFDSIPQDGSESVRQYVSKVIAKDAPGIDPDRLSVEVLRCEASQRTTEGATKLAAPEGYSGILTTTSYTLDLAVKVSYQLPEIFSVYSGGRWALAEAGIDRSMLVGTEVILR